MSSAKLRQATAPELLGRRRRLPAAATKAHHTEPQNCARALPPPRLLPLQVTIQQGNAAPFVKQARVALTFDGRPLARAPSQTPPPSLTTQVDWKLPLAPLGELMADVMNVRSF